VTLVSYPITMLSVRRMLSRRLSIIEISTNPASGKTRRHPSRVSSEKKRQLVPTSFFSFMILVAVSALADSRLSPTWRRSRISGLSTLRLNIRPYIPDRSVPFFRAIRSSGARKLLKTAFAVSPIAGRHIHRPSLISFSPMFPPSDTPSGDPILLGRPL